MIHHAITALSRARKAKRKAKAKRIRKVRKPTNAALVKRADKLFSLWVRSHGACVSGREKHSGPLQCAHGISRRYRATRWDSRNAFSLCAGCHMFFTHRPLEWTDWLVRRLGATVYESLTASAMFGGKQDMAQVVAELEGL